MKKILFFATMFVVALCATALVSCSSDKDDKKDEPGKNDYEYNLKINYEPDMLAIYSDITITYEFADGYKVTDKVSDGKITKSYTSKTFGPVKVQLNGTLNTSVVEELKSYPMGGSYSCDCNGNFKSSYSASTVMGRVLLAKYTNLSDVIGAHTTFLFGSSDD